MIVLPFVSPKPTTTQSISVATGCVSNEMFRMPLLKLKGVARCSNATSFVLSVKLKFGWTHSWSAYACIYNWWSPISTFTDKCSVLNKTLEVCHSTAVAYYPLSYSHQYLPEFCHCACRICMSLLHYGYTVYEYGYDYYFTNLRNIVKISFYWVVNTNIDIFLCCTVIRVKGTSNPKKLLNW